MYVRSQKREGRIVQGVAPSLLLELQVALECLSYNFDVVAIPTLDDLPGEDVNTQEEEQYVCQVFGGKKWTELDPKSLESSDLPALLSARAFHYYFPGLIRAAMKFNPYLVHEMFFGLESLEYDQTDSFMAKRFELFTYGQLKAVIRGFEVLAHIMRSKGEDWLEGECVASIKVIEVYLKHRLAPQ